MVARFTGISCRPTKHYTIKTMSLDPTTTFNNVSVTDLVTYFKNCPVERHPAVTTSYTCCYTIIESSDNILGAYYGGSCSYSAWKSILSQSYQEIKSLGFGQYIALSFGTW